MKLIDYLRKPRNKRERKVASHARRRERERIIALLEADKCELEESCMCGATISHMVATIRGNK